MKKIDADLIKRRIEDAELGLSDFRQDLRKRIESYNGVVKAKTFPWVGCSNIDLRIGTTAVETIVPRIIKAIHDIKPIARIMPRKGDAVMPADMWEDFLDWSLETEFRKSGQSYLEVKEDVYRGACRDGTSIEKVRWLTQENTFSRIESGARPIQDPETGYPMFDPLTGQLMQEEYEEEVVETETTYDAPVVELVDLKDIVIPKNARHEQRGGSLFIAQKFRMTASDLRREAKAGRYNEKAVNQVIDGKVEVPDDEIDTLRQQIQGISPIGEHDEAELHEYWGAYDLDGDGIDEEVQIVMHLDTKAVLYADYNPFRHGKRPYKKYGFLPREGMFFDMGIMELVEQHSKTINTLMNQLIDDNTLTNMPIFKVKERDGIKDIEFFPGAKWPVWESSDVEQLLMQNTVQFDIMVLQTILGFVQKLTGATDYSMGQTSQVSENRTKGGILGIIEEGNIRFDLTIRRFQDCNAEEWSQILQLNSQYREKAEFARITGEQEQPVMVKITRDDIQDQPDVYPQGNVRTSNKVLEQQTWTEVLQMLGPDQSGDVDTRRVKQKYLEAKGIKDWAAIIKPAQEGQQLQQMGQQMQQMQEQMEQMVKEGKQLKEKLEDTEKKRRIDKEAHEAEKTMMREIFDTKEDLHNLKMHAEVSAKDAKL